jgi:hypothetical protein
MSEVGLVPFACVALEVSREVVPAYSHRFSPQRFTQPQLLAILCLMRYEDWTFRAEVPITQTELDGHCAQIKIPRISVTIPSNRTHPEYRTCRIPK